MELSERERASLLEQGIDVARLVARGMPPDQWSLRLRHSIEIAAGRAGHDDRGGLQQPTTYFYPDLPQVQFYDPAQFAWTAPIEAAAPAIRAELTTLMERGTDEFRAYIHKDTGAEELRANQALLGSRDWSVLSLCENGWLAPKLVERFPRTWETILRHAPLPRIPGWGPTVLFSLLKAGAHIAPHCGMFNTRLICHLPLIVPTGCRFRVGNEERQWEEGKLLTFDDSIEHEAWNDDGEDRVVLIFDIWRPELSERERRELTLLFAD